MFMSMIDYYMKYEYDYDIYSFRVFTFPYTYINMFQIHICIIIFAHMCDRETAAARNLLVNNGSRATAARNPLNRRDTFQFFVFRAPKYSSVWPQLFIGAIYPHLFVSRILWDVLPLGSQSMRETERYRRIVYEWIVFGRLRLLS